MGLEFLVVLGLLSQNPTLLKLLPYCNIVESVCVNYDRVVGRSENLGVPVVM